MFLHMMSNIVKCSPGVGLKALILAVLVVGVYSHTNAQDLFSPEYPGVGNSGRVLIVANSQVRDAISAYQRVYGSMPGSWNDVVAAGIFNNDLLGFQLENIDPNDPNIDFRGDLHLDFHTLRASGEVLLFTFWKPSDNDVSRNKIEHVDSYTTYLSRVASTLDLSQDQAAIIDYWLNDEAQLIQFSHLHQLFLAVDDFRRIHGKFPDDLHELVSSGIGPLKNGSINPVTGNEYAFDGSPGDIFYHVRENGKGYVVRHIDKNFEPQFGFSY